MQTSEWFCWAVWTVSLLELSLLGSQKFCSLPQLTSRCKCPCPGSCRLAYKSKSRLLQNTSCPMSAFPNHVSSKCCFLRMHLPWYSWRKALRSRGSSSRYVCGMKSSFMLLFLNAWFWRSKSCRLLHRPCLLVSRLQFGMWFTICSPAKKFQSVINYFLC